MSTVSSIETIKSMLTPVFMRYDIKGAILFGSFAKGSATEHSDVDLLVESNLRGLRFVGFSEAVREAVGRPVDIFDVSHIEKDSRIDREIRETGVMIYQRH